MRNAVKDEAAAAKLPAEDREKLEKAVKARAGGFGGFSRGGFERRGFGGPERGEPPPRCFCLSLALSPLPPLNLSQHSNTSKLFLSTPPPPNPKHSLQNPAPPKQTGCARVAGGQPAGRGGGAGAPAEGAGGRVRPHHLQAVRAGAARRGRRCRACRRRGAARVGVFVGFFWVGGRCLLGRGGARALRSAPPHAPAAPAGRSSHRSR